MLHHYSSLRQRLGGLAARYGFGTMVAILLVTALFLGTRIYQKMSPAGPTASVPSPSPSPLPPGDGSNRELTLVVPPGRNLTEDEKAVLALPKDDSDAKKNNYELIQRTAKAARVIDVSGCLMQPVVPMTNATAIVVFENKDSVPHQIQTDLEHSVTVPPGGRVETSDLFGFGYGVYGCSCDGVNDCGLFLVTP